MRRIGVWVAIATAALVLEVLLFNSWHVARPLLLVPAILATSHWSGRRGGPVALWLGLVMDVMSMQPLGTYVLIAGGMFGLARWLRGRGLHADSMLNVGVFTLVMLVWQYAILLILLGAQAGMSMEMLVVWPYMLIQVVLTTVVGFWCLRAARRIIEV